MMPFVEQELVNVFQSLLENFVKLSKLGDSPTLLEMFAVDLEEESNLFECRKVTIELGAKEEILRLNLSEQKRWEFKAECLKYYKAITEKRGRVNLRPGLIRCPSTLFMPVMLPLQKTKNLITNINLFSE